MSDKKDISKKKFESYKRNHTGGNFREKELSKISRDKKVVSRLREKTENKLKNIDLENFSDDDIDEIDEMENQIKKTNGNMRTHKERFISLSENEDFE